MSDNLSLPDAIARVRLVAVHEHAVKHIDISERTAILQVCDAAARAEVAKEDQALLDELEREYGDIRRGAKTWAELKAHVAQLEKDVKVAQGQARLAKDFMRHAERGEALADNYADTQQKRAEAAEAHAAQFQQALRDVLLKMSLWSIDNSGHYHEDDVEDALKAWTRELEAALAGTPASQEPSR